MATKKKTEEIVEVKPEVKEPEVEARPDLLVRVRNAGKPFPCNLIAYGYGMRWPTNAVYAIPQSVYLKLLDEGLDGARV